MTDNAQTEGNPETSISEEDLFGLPTEPTGGGEENPESDASLEAAEDNSPEAEATDKAPAEEPADSEPSEPSELDLMREQLETMSKRLDDTRKWGNEANQKLTAVLRKVQAGEELTPEDVQVLESPDSQENPMQAVAQRVNDELTATKHILEKRGIDVDGAVSAFDQLAVYDKQIVQDLLNLPANEQTAFIIEQGEQLKDVLSYVEKQGSVLAALKGASKKGDAYEAKLREQIREELEAEFKKERDELISGAKRPAIRGQSDKAPSDDASTLDDAFNAVMAGR